MLLWESRAAALHMMCCSTLSDRGRGGLPSISLGAFFFAHTGTPGRRLSLFQSYPTKRRRQWQPRRRLPARAAPPGCWRRRRPERAQAQQLRDAEHGEGPPLGAAQRASRVRRSELVGRKLVLRENHCKQLRLMKKKLKYDYTYKPYKPGYKPLYKLL